MGIKAIDYENLKEGDLITWYGVHVLRWEDDIRPYGIEPTMAFVQDDTQEKQIADLVEVAQGLIDFEKTALMDDHVPFELIEKAKQALAQVGGDQS